MQQTSQSKSAGGQLIGKEDAELLHSWFSFALTGKKLKLIYSSAADGKDADTIKKACKNKKEIIVVYKSKETGKVFGGFIEDDGYYSRPFLFSLTEKKKYDATGYGQEYESGGSCQDCAPGYYRTGDPECNVTDEIGPKFGKDLWVEPDTFKGHVDSSFFERDLDEMSGGKEFTCELYEIYELQS